MANRNFANSRMYTGHVMPVLLDCNFVVDSANGNGLGIRSLKGPYVQAVYMHTSATPAAGNPNPASGTIVVQLQDNYSRIYTGGNSIVSPLGSSAATQVAGDAYVITSLGTMTAAQWVAAGVPAGVVAAGPGGLPAVGTAYIAASSSSLTGSATAALTAATGSGVATIETVGDSNQSLAPLPTSNQGFGGQIILQCRDYAGALVAPADGSVISLSLLLSNSSILIAGE
jgi:hypothetical protein